MQLEDLKKSVSEMSTEELLKLIVEIRNERRAHRTQAATKRKAKEDPIEKAVNKLTPEQKTALAKMLGG